MITQAIMMFVPSGILLVAVIFSLVWRACH